MRECIDLSYQKNSKTERIFRKRELLMLKLAKTLMEIFLQVKGSLKESK